MNVDMWVKVSGTILTALGVLLAAVTFWSQGLAVRSAGVYLRTAELLHQQADRAQQSEPSLTPRKIAELEKRLRHRAVQAQLEAAALLEVPTTASRWVINRVLVIPAAGIGVTLALLIAGRYSWATTATDTAWWVLMAVIAVYFTAQYFAVRAARRRFCEAVEVPVLWFQARNWRELRSHFKANRGLVSGGHASSTP